jgi:hypothetical protein
MSLNNDYTSQYLAAQRLRDLQAEAANDHLVRITRGDNSPWWRRIFQQSPIPGANQPTEASWSVKLRVIEDSGPGLTTWHDSACG